MYPDVKSPYREHRSTAAEQRNAALGIPREDKQAAGKRSPRTGTAAARRPPCSATPTATWHRPSGLTSRCICRPSCCCSVYQGLRIWPATPGAMFCPRTCARASATNEAVAGIPVTAAAPALFACSSHASGADGSGDLPMRVRRARRGVTAQAAVVPEMFLRAAGTATDSVSRRRKRRPRAGRSNSGAGDAQLYGCRSAERRRGRGSLTGRAVRTAYRLQWTSPVADWGSAQSSPRARFAPVE